MFLVTHNTEGFTNDTFSVYSDLDSFVKKCASLYEEFIIGDDECFEEFPPELEFRKGNPLHDRLVVFMETSKPGDHFLLEAEHSDAFPAYRYPITVGTIIHINDLAFNKKEVQ